ncbi:Protein of unknown function [Paenibacillus algorifonticola]|uniref:DUF2975 domain-containing protein n=1 Tax=Paenibacillus algorifonticola TaxID=684063 RepID=A0A1I2FHS0_9BACL|nr:DUF2975 domain-containing protein [Paenibacillus algorifonticola]SFF04543.1 Protein of unknown function [Paenibacillus algorifonticola]
MNTFAAELYPDDAYMKYLVLIDLYATALPFYFALYQAMPLFYLLAEKDDAPGIIVIGMVMIFASMVIAVFAAVLQKLLKEAIDIKSENDLTV